MYQILLLHSTTSCAISDIASLGMHAGHGCPHGGLQPEFHQDKGKNSYRVKIHMGEVVNFYSLSVKGTWLGVSRDTVKAGSSGMSTPKPHMQIFKSGPMLRVFVDSPGLPLSC